MQEITINQILYKIYIETGKTEVTFEDSETGLVKLFCLMKITIEPRNKHIQTEYRSFDITPTGKEIYNDTHIYSSSDVDFQEFESSALGMAIKQSAINGVFRFILKNTLKVFDSNGQLITEQPVLPPAEEPAP